jgi:hypothetical protein
MHAISFEPVQARINVASFLPAVGNINIPKDQGNTFQKPLYIAPLDTLKCIRIILRDWLIASVFFLAFTKVTITPLFLPPVVFKAWFFGYEEKCLGT